MPQSARARPLREVTLRTIMLAALLAALLAAANAYLGLKVGMTVSASIPAAVIAMAVLRVLRERSILESNIVQTAASAGEALAAGVIFTLPSLLLLGYWSDFRYLETAAVAALGGVLGVLFAIPLRRVLLHHRALGFPEGVATAEVLRAGQHGGGLGLIAAGAAAAATLKVFQSGFQLLAGSIAGGVTLGRSVFAAGGDLSVALLAVGYIVGLNIAALVFAGGLLAWLIVLPIYAAWYGPPPGTEGLVGLDLAFAVWSTKIRYMGVGAMLVGGVWALLSILGPLRAGMRRTFPEQSRVPDRISRAEQDLPPRLVFWGLLALTLPLLAVYRLVLDPAALEAGRVTYGAVMLFGLVFALVAGFLFSAVAGYMSGLVGSSNNPVSGVTIATVLTVSLALFFILGAGAGFTDVIDGERARAAAAAAILVGAVVCCAAAISGDTMQDLKAGQLVGATPYKQQLMQMVGVLVAALTLAPVLSVLYNAYGLGGMFPRDGMDPGQALAAPHATLMASVARGVFARNLEWGMVGMGAALAVVVIGLDRMLGRRKSSFRAPVLAVAVGLYLPLQLSTAIFAGGLVVYLARQATARRGGDAPGARAGVLFASGLIAGEAIAGVLLAVPFAVSRRTDVLRLAPEGFEPYAQTLGVLAFLLVLLWLYRVSLRTDPVSRQAGEESA